MSASIAPPTSPRPVAAPPPPLTLVEPAPSAVDVGEAEMHRWLIGLTTPFLLGSFFFALSIETSVQWLIGVALALGPMLFMFMTIYLSITSDTNGGSDGGAAHA
jgi:hypothetical protein